MPLQKLQFRPGVNREGTTLANEGGWFDCDKVRFRSGYPEKLGGWSPLSANTFLGVCRSLWNWVTLKNYNLLGLGTNLKFYVENGGVYFDVTPLRETNTNPSNQITLAVTNGSNLLTITDTGADSLQVNDFVTLAGATTLGGNVDAAVLNNEFQIVNVLSGVQYQVRLSVTANTTASSSTMTGLTIAYQINTGLPIYTEGTGWGAGPWPLYTVITLTNPFTAASIGVTTITVTTPSAHNLTTNDYVVFSSIASNVCGIVGSSSFFETTFQVTVTGANTFTISTVIGQAPGPVITYPTVSTAASGGAVTMYVPNPLPTTASNQRGWGSGYTTGFGLQLRLWSQSNFGEQLLFSPRGGALYVWDPGAGATPAFTTRGALISGTDVPSTINQIMVSDSTRIVIAFGCNDYGAYGTTALDPLLVRWSAQESYTNWTPSLLNQAGSFRLSRGSEIVGALQTRQEIIVFTDAAVYSMQYLGPPLVWGFTLLADNISIASPNAIATAAGVVYWMGTDKFYVYSGRIETLPCAVRQFIFSNINRNQEAQFFAGSNEGYSEIWWFYCSADSTTVNRYVIFNYLDRVWYYGELDRTAWLDSPIRQFPQATTSGNYVVFHEDGVNDGYVESSEIRERAIISYVQSSDFDIGDGHNYGFVWRMLPDITFDGSFTGGSTSEDARPTVTFTLRPRQNPGSGYKNAGFAPVSAGGDPAQTYATQNSYNVQEFTEIIYTRVRGRQMALRVSSSRLGTQWQLGVPRMDVRPDGRN
jgi:hypothetical protein